MIIKTILLFFAILASGFTFTKIMAMVAGTISKANILISGKKDIIMTNSVKGYEIFTLIVITALLWAIFYYLQ